MFIAWDLRPFKTSSTSQSPQTQPSQSDVSTITSQSPQTQPSQSDVSTITSQSQQTQSSQSGVSTREKKKVVKHIILPIILFLLAIPAFIIVVEVYSIGADIAKNQTEFKVIEIYDKEEKTSTRWVVLTENDDRILLAELISEDNGIAEINTKKQKVIENGEYDYEIIKYLKAEVPNENDG